MRVSWVLLPGVAAAALLAQEASDLFEKAPPHIDKALRERISVFYQAHVDGQFRLADTVVHEDSKDAFFVATKSRYKGFEILRIVYSDGFTKARAAVSVDTDLVMPGIGKSEVSVPLTTLWKYDGGEWWWYVVPNAPVETPFGFMQAGPTSEESSPAAKLGAMPDINAIRRQVTVSKTEVRLSSYEASEDEVIVTNGMPGAISLSLTSGSFPGFEAKLDRTEVKAGEQARIQFRCDPADNRPKPTLRATLRIQPTNHVIPIRVTFAVPPEIEKQIPNN